MTDQPEAVQPAFPEVPAVPAEPPDDILYHHRVRYLDSLRNLWGHREIIYTLAERDFKGFGSFLSSEAIFFSGTSVEHGAAAIEAAWRPYFTSPTAPFSWVPDNVQVLPSGKLALSSGPVYIQGKEVSRYNSIWRLESANTWRVVFDKGEAVCSAKP